MDAGDYGAKSWVLCFENNYIYGMSSEKQKLYIACI